MDTTVGGFVAGGAHPGTFCPFVQQYFPLPPFSQQSGFVAPFLQQYGPLPPVAHYKRHILVMNYFNDLIYIRILFLVLDNHNQLFLWPLVSLLA